MTMNCGAFALQMFPKHPQTLRPFASREVSIAEGPPEQRLVEEGLISAILWARKTYLNRSITLYSMASLKPSCQSQRYI